MSNSILFIILRRIIEVRAQISRDDGRKLTEELIKKNNLLVFIDFHTTNSFISFGKLIFFNVKSKSS